MKSWITFIAVLLAGASYAQTRVDVGVQNFAEDPSGTVHFDVVLECTREDTAFIGFSDLVFTADWTQFTNPAVTVTRTSDVNSKSRSGNTNINVGFARFGIQNNSDKVIYTMDPKFIDYQYQFNDNVIALDNGTPYVVAHIEITGYTGIDDPALAWVQTGASNENTCNMSVFSTRSPKFVTTKATLRYADFPTLGSPRLNLSVFLEGPYNSATGEMNTTLNSSGFLPLQNPYSAAPWNYTGGDSVTAIPNADVVDWVLVEIRETNVVTSASASSSIGMRAGFLLKDGRIVDLDGSSYLEFDNVEFNPSKKQFVVIYHRNHLAVMSADSLEYNDSVPPIARWEYDFTTGISAVYDSTNGAKVKGGVTMMIAGDGDSNGQVQNQDKNDIWTPTVGLSGYLKGDYDMNGQIQNQDKLDIWRYNPGLGTAIP